MGQRRHPLIDHLLLDRRTLLQAMAASTPLAAAACAGAQEVAKQTTPTTVSIPVPNDDSPWWLQGNFAPVADELNALDLDVTGSLPASLSGLYVRNGSNPRSGESSHWFMGDGMIHGVSLLGGAAPWYRNRYVATAQRASESGTISRPSGAASASNVSLIYHADRLLSLGEVGHPFEISTDDLSTVGVTDFEGRLKTNMTAHPKIDPATGRMHFFGYDFTAPYLTYMVANPDGTLDTIVPIELARSHMIHDFAITERHAIFWVLPVMFSLDALSSGMPFAWDDAVPAQVGVIPLDGTADQMKWFDVDPCMIFHGANAYEDDGVITVDVCWLSAAFDGRDLSQTSKNELRRWSIDLSGDKVSEDVRSQTLQDFPQIDRRFAGRRHRYTWLTRIADVGEVGIDLAGITLRDERSGDEIMWDPHGRYAPSEAFFVPESSSAGEGEGYLLAFAYDRTRDSSDLLVFEALEIKSGPIAQVHLPRRVPNGFHGQWVPAV